MGRKSKLKHQRKMILRTGPSAGPRRYIKPLIVAFIIPLLVTLAGTLLINFFESSLSIQYSGMNEKDEHVFAIKNNGKIDMNIDYAAIGVINESYITNKTIGEMDPKKVIPIDGNKKTLVFTEWKMFIPNREFLGPNNGKITNLIGMNLKAMEERKMVVENINKGDLSLFIADFYIVYESSPTNIAFKLFHNLMHLVGSKIGNDGAFFRIEDGRIIDFANPFDQRDFERTVREKMHNKVKSDK